MYLIYFTCSVGHEPNFWIELIVGEGHVPGRPAREAQAHLQRPGQRLPTACPMGARRRDGPSEVEPHPVCVELEPGASELPTKRLDGVELQIPDPNDALLRPGLEGSHEHTVVRALRDEGRWRHDSATAGGRGGCEEILGRCGRGGLASLGPNVGFPLLCIREPPSAMTSTRLTRRNACPQAANAPFGAPALLFQVFEKGEDHEVRANPTGPGGEGMFCEGSFGPHRRDRRGPVQRQ